MRFCHCILAGTQACLTCSNGPGYFVAPITVTPLPQTGWICPVCGKGNAPWSLICPCRYEKQPQPVPTIGENT